jgi:hypothetical protein
LFALLVTVLFALLSGSDVDIPEARDIREPLKLVLVPVVNLIRRVDALAAVVTLEGARERWRLRGRRFRLIVVLGNRRCVLLCSESERFDYLLVRSLE